jgi:hypothetical protein
VTRFFGDPTIRAAAWDGRRAAWIGALAACLVAIVTWAGPAMAQAFQPLAIVTQDGKRHAFQVELASNDEERSQGLMYRRSMAPDRGMLFDFGRVEPLSMWMKNTYIPLDMLFIRPDGSIARVAANAEPLSTRTIPSGEPVLAVLELNGGTAERLGIKAGDRVDHPIFKR